MIATRASFQRYINIASIVQDAGKKLGLNIQIKPINPNDYGDLFFSDSARKGIDLFISENYADIPEPLETLYPTVTPQPPNAVSYNYDPTTTRPSRATSPGARRTGRREACRARRRTPRALWPTSPPASRWYRRRCRSS